MEYTRGLVPPDREKAIELSRSAIQVYFVDEDIALRSQPDVHDTTTRTSIRENRVRAIVSAVFQSPTRAVASLAISGSGLPAGDVVAFPGGWAAA